MNPPFLVSDSWPHIFKSVTLLEPPHSGYPKADVKKHRHGLRMQNMGPEIGSEQERLALASCSSSKKEKGALGIAVKLFPKFFLENKRVAYNWGVHRIAKIH